MGMQLVGVFLLLSALVAVSLCQGTADDIPTICTNPNEELQDCGPSCGDRKCSNQAQNNLKCAKDCKSGCFCKGGYVRNTRNICIPSYMCGSSG